MVILVTVTRVMRWVRKSKPTGAKRKTRRHTQQRGGLTSWIITMGFPRKSISASMPSKAAYARFAARIRKADWPWTTTTLPDGFVVCCVARATVVLVG